jgi:hypothetical protein
MKKTMTQYDIAEELMNDINANWSRAGAFALAEYFEQIEMDTNEELDFDAVAIRCEFSQYESLQDWASEYGLDCIDLGVESDDDDETKEEAIRDYIEERGTLIDFNGGIIVSQF